MHHNKDYLLNAGVTEEEYDRLLCLMAETIEKHWGQDAAVGLICDGLAQPSRNDNSVNWMGPNVAAAIIRWSKKGWRIKTFMVTRSNQFFRPDGGRGHFRVAVTRIGRM